MGEGNHVDGLILLSTSLIGEDADLQTQCSSICTSHQIPANWIDSPNPTYASGLKTGCELIYGVGWPDRGCYPHTSAKVGMANGAPQRFCQLLIDLLFLARRRAMQKLVFVTRQGDGDENVANARASVRQYGGGDSGNALDAPVCTLATLPVLPLRLVVLRDGQGNPLMNNYRYFFRLRAYNGFQPSIPSENISVHPIGDVPKEVLNLTAECFSSNNSEQFRCQTGMSVSWKRWISS
jgi:hypothetical protein